LSGSSYSFSTYCTSHHCAILKSAAGSGAEGWSIALEELTHLLHGDDEAKNEWSAPVSISYEPRHKIPAEWLMRFMKGSRPIAWQDPFPVKPDRFALVARMIFDTKEDLDRALQSEERSIARKDFSAFPPFHGLVYHQATISEEVFST
jgi:hypothetical protein